MRLPVKQALLTLKQADHKSNFVLKFKQIHKYLPSRRFFDHKRLRKHQIRLQLATFRTKTLNMPLFFNQIIKLQAIFSTHDF